MSLLLTLEHLPGTCLAALQQEWHINSCNMSKNVNGAARYKQHADKCCCSFLHDKSPSSCIPALVALDVICSRSTGPISCRQGSGRLFKLSKQAGRSHRLCTLLRSTTSMLVEAFFRLNASAWLHMCRAPQFCAHTAGSTRWSASALPLSLALPSSRAMAPGQPCPPSWPCAGLSPPCASTSSRATRRPLATWTPTHINKLSCCMNLLLDGQGSHLWQPGCLALLNR